MKLMKSTELYKALNVSDYEYGQIVSRLGREPNETEIYLFSAMWSEHCSYKHSKKYISDLPKVGSIGADENAGGVLIGDHVIVFKVESHNHPSAVEPFQGAATGIGGIIRDIIAVGARPVALLDSLKFGNLKDPKVKHLLDGVVKGISSYGNSIGVPTIGGEIAFDESYSSSPLVNVMAVGIAHKNDIVTAKAESGGIVVLIGSHTGRDGIHGASFASKELSENSKDDRPSVQVGDPFMEKNVIEATLEILKLSEIICCQDCGAAGILSSTSEMSLKGECGISLFLDKVHLREKGMKPWEIMLSESQERMIFVVTEEGLSKIMDISQKYDIPASVIGETTDSGLFDLFWNDEIIASLPAEVLCEGPRYTLSDIEPEYIGEYKTKKLTQAKLSLEESVNKLCSDANFASKKWVFSQYDHTVGNRTVIKPGMSGASAIWLTEEGGILGLTIDSNPKQVFLDPLNGTKNTVWEAYRNLVSCGFEPKAITNCLNYGNPEKDEVAYQLVESIKGMASACIEANIPVVSGNVSLYNESQTHRVYPTPAIGMIGYAEKFENLIQNKLNDGDTVFLLGKQMQEDSKVGGSLYQMAFYGFIGGEVDEVDFELEIKLKELILKLRDENLLNGCVDVSEGGLMGALLEGLKAGNSGFNGNLANIDDFEKELFGEICGRYLISTSNPEIAKKLLEDFKIQYKQLGKCNNSDTIEFDGYEFNLSKLFELYDNSIELEMEQ